MDTMICDLESRVLWVAERTRCWCASAQWGWVRADSCCAEWRYLSASIALCEKSACDRKRLKAIGFSERDLAAYHHGLALVDFYVSTNYDPEVSSTQPRIGARL
jgi:hypothetical protein